MLFILAPAVMIFLMALMNKGFAGYVFTEDFATTVSVGVLLALIGIGVAVLIVNGTKMSAFEKLEDKKLFVSDAKRIEVEKAHKAYTPKFAVLIAVGIMLIFAGVVQIIILGDMGEFIESCSVSILLTCIAVAVFLFILAGIRHDTNMQILNMDDDDDDDDDDEDFDTSTKAGRVGEAVTTCLWMLVLIAYFLWSFLGHAWHISWILFPIAGFISGGIDAIVKAACSEDKK